MPDLVTVGHGTQDRSALGSLLRGAGIELVVDVRRFPRSKSNPDVHREALQTWLQALGMTYRWEERLGGRRHPPPGAVELDTWWTVPAFRAYAAYTRTPEFRDVLIDVLADASRHRVVLMCSESLWWRCHRRLIADVAILSHGAAVAHLFPSGRLDAHTLASGIRIRADGLPVWDADPRLK
jgi:uncharacterized protein (DUF488 family)